jgi:hypothetical protein
MCMSRMCSGKEDSDVVRPVYDQQTNRVTGCWSYGAVSGRQDFRTAARHETGNETVVGLHLIRVDVQGLCKYVQSADVVT